VRKVIVGLVLFLLLAGGLVVAADERDEPEIQPAPRQSGNAQPIRPELIEHLQALQRVASRNGGNRAAGTRGYDQSADYVAERLRAAGYEVRRQNVRFPFFEERARPRLVAGGRTLRPRRDFRTLIYSGSGSVTATARAVQRNGCERSDYDGVERGQVALVPRGPCTLRRKTVHAQNAGASAILIVNQDNSTIPGTLGRPGIRIPSLILASRAGEGLDGRRIELTVRTTSERRNAPNVIAEPPGEQRRDIVMAGGHLDSVADGPGMNDNGSGVAALLYAAETLAGSRTRVRFAFWGAEELGLYGSRRYVRGLSRAERRDIRAYVNLDMVGSPNPARMVYDTDDFVENALRGALARATNRRIEEESLGGSSDHAPFARAGIPVGGYYTGSSEPAPGGERRDPCYHRRCDRLSNVNRGILTVMARAVTTALRDLGRG
jgi:acetylornithine deacetylase/succinyl-diaminopimelate desuccinylase-like protein